MRTLGQILNPLTDKQKLLLADTIKFGAWGSCDAEFSDKTDYAYGYITDDAHLAWNFTRRELSALFRSLFKALGLEGNNQSKRCEEFVWIYDWWDDGSGSVLFIRDALVDDFEEWAKNYNANQ